HKMELFRMTKRPYITAQFFKFWNGLATALFIDRH
ncbi:MAG: hypothetical protein ACJAS1_001835, partial [Oleiphilaceae bacterium]